MIRYSKKAGVSPLHLDSDILLATAEGGRVWIDQTVLKLWESADGQTLEGILDNTPLPSVGRTQILAGLACLAEAGLLVREGCETPAYAGFEAQSDRGLISIILVGYNSLPWLDACLTSIEQQTYPSLEIILIDNASGDGTAEWIESRRPQVRFIRQEQACSLAQALNLGMRSARGLYYLLLNPDVRLEPDAVAQMVKTAQQEMQAGSPPCAAVAAKLRLLWAPGFLNGLGNLVGAFSWGTDIGLGRLDLGQYDEWDEVPSACFAATLIPANALEQVGQLDEGFPMYYEDSEWSYRARLLGFSVRAAPQAIAYHSFNAPAMAGESNGLAPAKLRQVTFGRLRFIARINGPLYYLRFLLAYFSEDVLRGLVYLLRGRPEMAGALLGGWADLRRTLPELRRQRVALQSRRRVSDRELYHSQHKAPVPLIRAGLPVLSWDVICHEYLPLFLSGQTRPAPEFESAVPGYDQIKQGSRTHSWTRFVDAIRNEGLGKAFQRLGRQIQWRLMQP